MYNTNFPFGSLPPAQEEVIQVNGKNGANAVNIAPKSSKLVLDMSGTMVWLITTDGAGYKTVTPYDITQHKEEPSPEISGIEELKARMTDLENTVRGFINEFTTDTATDKQK